MKCLILAAGYATRLYPLTENFPKPLLEVKGKTIIDWLTDDIEASGTVEEYIVVSNHKFALLFEEWAKSKKCKITVLDDGTISNDTRLGAVMDIKFAIDKLSIDDDLLVIAGDNLLNFSLARFIEYAQQHNSSCVMRYFEGDSRRLSKSGVLVINESERVLCMQEKPAIPSSNWCCPPFYYYARDDISLVGTAISEGCAVDAPGSYISWLCNKRNVYAMLMPGERYDIGTLENYNKIKKDYNGF